MVPLMSNAGICSTRRAPDLASMVSPETPSFARFCRRATSRIDSCCKPRGRARTFGSIEKGCAMGESVYKVIELVGTSTESWEKAAGAAVARASKSLRDLRVAEVMQLDMAVEDGKV